LDSLKDILGSVGQGASKNQTESMINAYLDGHLPKEKLVSYFTKMAISPTSDISQVAALNSAGQAAAGEKARQAIEWLKNAPPQDLANNSGLSGIGKILGTTGNGAGQSFTRNAVRAYNMGAGNEDELLKMFTKLATAAAK